MTSVKFFVQLEILEKKLSDWQSITNFILNEKTDSMRSLTKQLLELATKYMKSPPDLQEVETLGDEWSHDTFDEGEKVLLEIQREYCHSNGKLQLASLIVAGHGIICSEYLDCVKNLRITIRDYITKIRRCLPDNSGESERLKNHLNSFVEGHALPNPQHQFDFNSVN